MLHVVDNKKQSASSFLQEDALYLSAAEQNISGFFGGFFFLGVQGQSWSRALLRACICFTDVVNIGLLQIK